MTLGAWLGSKCGRYTPEEAAALEGPVRQHYHQCLQRFGVSDYSMDMCERDWKLAVMYFPVFAALWFGAADVEDLVDPDFPVRFIPRVLAAIERSNALSVLPSFKCNVLIPMAGAGSRFACEGYVLPKPIVPVGLGGEPMIAWVVENMRVNTLDVDQQFICVIQEGHDREHGLTQQLEKLSHKVQCQLRVVRVPGLTEGQACTCLAAKEYIDSSDALFIVNSDQFLEWDADKFMRTMQAQQKAGISGSSLTFHVPFEANDSKWGFIETDARGNMLRCVPKVIISENAEVGCYYWASGDLFVGYAQKMVAIEPGSPDDPRSNNELYCSNVYNFAIQDGHRFTIYHAGENGSGLDKHQHPLTCVWLLGVDWGKMWGLGIPRDLEKFCCNYLKRAVRSLPDATVKFVSAIASADAETINNLLAPKYARQLELSAASCDKTATAAFVSDAISGHARPLTILDMMVDEARGLTAVETDKGTMLVMQWSKDPCVTEIRLYQEPTLF